MQGWVDEEGGTHEGHGEGVVREVGECLRRVLLWKPRENGV